MMKPQEQMALLKRGIAQIVSEEELLAKIERAKKEGRPLRVKYGADPSAPDIHLGHTVPIRKLKQFQDLGHHVIFIIGDFTGRIGDPSGRSETRRQLTEDEVMANARTYQDQIFKILNPERTEVVFNSSWLGRLDFVSVIELAAKYTVARLLERDDFKRRLEEERPVSVHELLYPLAQAYDSVAIRADVELGGTDQTFNFLLTRDIQREYGQEPQVAVTMPLLEGTDGMQKMSKSLNNYIGINEDPRETYGKIMSVPDNLMLRYLELVTEVPIEELEAARAGLEDGSLHPRDLKMRLAREIVSMYHGDEAAQEAGDEFKRVFQEGDLPGEIPDVALSCSNTATLVRLLVETGLAPSNSEARRLISQGAVRLDRERVAEDREVLLSDGMILQVGKRRYCRIRLG
jgi:tyrosyl-tRNA synthetase